jgi:hypothetical protein
MKTTNIFKIASVLIGFGLLAACSTPDSRIKASPDVFARLNPDEQALVKVGKVAPGFDMDAVKLALGDPDRVSIHTDSTGAHQVWHYITYEDYQGVVIYGGYYHRFRGWGGPYFNAGVPFYNGYPARVHERMRIVFTTGNTVASTEEEK